MSPTQIKLAIAAGVALLAWLLTPRGKAADRVSRELEIDANILSPTFGMTDAEIAARERVGAPPNPAVDPRMRDLIDVSNTLIAEDDASS